MPELITAYRFDEDGYLMGTDKVMEGFLPPDDTLAEPEARDGYWPRYVDGAWTYEQMPSTAQDFIDLAIVIDHQSHTPHTEALRQIIYKLNPMGENPGELRINQDKGTNNLSIVKVPELTEAEAALKADEKTDDELSQQIYSLKEQLSSALLMGDDEWIAELQAEYKALMEV